MSRACETCEWWISTNGGIGECRGAPPAPDGEIGRLYPATNANDWCGAYRLAERRADGRDARVKS